MQRAEAGEYAVFIVLASCVNAPAGRGSTPATRPVTLAFLENAHVTRDYMAAQLVPPNASFEDNRVLSGHLSQTKAAQMPSRLR